MIEYRGCELPPDLYYDLDYLWVRPEADGTCRIGVTDPSQTMAGRVLHVSIKKVGTHFDIGRHVAVLESGKWVGGIPTPFAGTIVERNQRVLDNANLINIAPYTDAWLVLMRPDDPAHALDRLATGDEAIAKLKAWIDRYDVQCMRCAE